MESFTLSGSEITKWISSLVEALNKEVAILDFGPSSMLKDEDFPLLLGLQRSEFFDLVDVCRPHMNDTGVRTVENAVALFFMKMRLDLPQKVLALLFGITGQQRVSYAINVVAKWLDKDFVPLHLGFRHLSREEANQHDSTFFHRILESEPEALHTAWDATYLHVQKPSNFELQRKTFSMHKHRNLIKPMIGCFSDGYILESAGPYYTDSANNDARILQKMLEDNEPGSLRDFLQMGDVFILDRGFRDVVALLEELGYKVFMPDLVRGNHAFSATQANSSRRITMLRLVIEIVNGQLKQRFRFFDGTIQATYMPSIPIFFRIACAVHNLYGTRFRQSPEDEDYIVNRVQQDMNKSNDLQEYVETEGLAKKRVIWKSADEADLQGFPVLSIEDLKKVTLGTFQIKMADRYISQHCEDGLDYKISIHKEQATLFRVRLQSRFSRRSTHQIWVRVDPSMEGHDGITSYYCTCKTGSRTVGCCSHICSVLKYAGFDRNQPPTRRRRVRTLAFLDAAIDFTGDDEDEDE